MPMSDETREHIRAYIDHQGALGSRYRRALARRLGLEPDELAVVLHLGRGEMTAGQLSHAVVLGVAEIMSLIEKLEDAGHVVRRAHAEDPQLVAVALSESTLSELEAVMRPLVEDLDALAAQLGSREREVVGRFMEAVTSISEREAELAARAVLEGDGPLPSSAD